MVRDIPKNTLKIQSHPPKLLTPARKISCRSRSLTAGYPVLISIAPRLHSFLGTNFFEKTTFEREPQGLKLG